MIMENNNLSIVNIIHGDHLQTINALAAELGMGEDNISIPLSNNYFACHSWWSPEKYAAFKSVATLTSLGIDMTVYLPAIDALHEFVIDTSTMTVEDLENVPSLNMQNALTEMGLTHQIQE